MFKNYSVGKKISLGFASILILLCVTSAIAYWSLSTSADGFTGYREMHNTNVAGRVQANLLSERLNVKDYLLNETSGNAEEFRDLWTTVVELMDEAQKEITDPEQATKIRQTAANLKEYDEGFRQLTVYVKERVNLVARCWT